MRFFRDCRVSSVLESSCTSCTQRFFARRFLALTKKITMFTDALKAIQAAALELTEYFNFQRLIWLVKVGFIR